MRFWLALAVMALITPLKSNAAPVNFSGTLSLFETQGPDGTALAASRGFEFGKKYAFTFSSGYQADLAPVAYAFSVGGYFGTGMGYFTMLQKGQTGAAAFYPYLTSYWDDLLSLPSPVAYFDKPVVAGARPDRVSFGATFVGPVTGPTYSSFSFYADVEQFTFGARPQAVPEPETWLLMIVGFGVIGGLARRKPEWRQALRG